MSSQAVWFILSRYKHCYWEIRYFWFGHVILCSFWVVWCSTFCLPPHEVGGGLVVRLIFLLSPPDKRRKGISFYDHKVFISYIQLHPCSKPSVECLSLQSGITCGFPECGFPAYFCLSKHVFFREYSNSSQKIENPAGPIFSMENMFKVTKISWKTIVWKTRGDP